MRYWIYNYLASIVIAILLSWVIIPKILDIAFRRRLFDEQDERKIHHGAVPRLGGIAFLPAMIFSFCCVLGVNWRFGAIPISGDLGMTIMPIFFLMCSLMLMYLLGMGDDLVGIRYRAKFLIQIGAAVLIVLSGLWIKDLYGFLWIHTWPTVIGWLFTILLVVYVTNAINLIDGIDGLASGLSMIALLFFSYVFLISHAYVYSLVAGAMLGTMVPFFYYNVFGQASRHKKIFMGDTGSLTVGLVLSFLTVAVFNLQPENLPGGENITILAIAPIMLPCLDVIRVFLHRVRKGRNPFLPDKCHIHHKLLALGFVQRQALVAILATDALVIAANLLLAPHIGATLMIVIDVLGWTIANMVLTVMIHKRERKLGETLYE